MLTILSCLICNGKIRDAIYPAVGLEFLHNHSLLLDDIIDNSFLRRGEPTAWVKFGRSIAECISANYLASSFHAAALSRSPKRITEIFAIALKKAVEGEILDILFEQAGREDEKYVVKNRYKRVSLSDYFEMAGKKTGALFQACCETGGVCAGAKKREIGALKSYGFNIGMALQIKNDIIDIFGEEKETGKKIGDDIKERKLGNIVILLALKELPPSERKEILSVLRKRELREKDVKRAIGIIRKTNSLEKSFKLQGEFLQKAKRSLDFLPKNKWRGVMEDLADSVPKMRK
jgi:geranylgeranyl diphosphate synthase type I